MGKAWPGAAGQGRLGAAGHGAARQGKARQARLGTAWQGEAWRGRRGTARPGRAGLGEAWQGRRGVARHGEAWRGKVRQARLGVARQGEAWHGMARQARRGRAQLGLVRQGQAWQGRRGSAGRGAARHGRISWQTALGIAEWVIYPALAVRLAGKNYKNCSAEGGRRLHTQVVISRVLKRNYAKENGAISDGNRGIIYANWQKSEGTGPAPERAPVSGGNPGPEVPDQIMPASAPPDLRQTG